MYKFSMTLIELLIVVAIVGILAAVVIQKPKSGCAKCPLMAQIEQEQCFYATTMSALGLGSYDSDSRDYYDIEVASADASSFLITATPNGNQANDSTCNVFAIRNRPRNHGLCRR